MSTVAIIASILPNDTYFNFGKEAVAYRKNDIVANKIWMDGYPEASNKAGIIDRLREDYYNRIKEGRNVLSWQYAFAGHRNRLLDFNSYPLHSKFENTAPVYFTEKLLFDKWVKENFDADYLYWLVGEWKWKELHHFNENTLKVDLSVPDGQWFPIHLIGGNYGTDNN